MHAFSVLQNDSTVNVGSLLGRYSFAATAGKLKYALWRQKWIRVKNESNFVFETAVAALEANCNHLHLHLKFIYLDRPNYLIYVDYYYVTLPSKPEP